MSQKTGRTNLLFITIYTGIGGGETLQLNLMRSLDHRRYALHLITPREGEFPREAAALGVTTHIIPFRGTPTFFLPQLWANFPIVDKLRAFLRKHRIDAILTDYHSLPFIVPAAETEHIPVIWNAMGWWFPIYSWQRAFFQQRIQKIMAITGAVKDRLLHTPPVIPSDCIDVLIPGVDPDVHHPGIDGSPVRKKLGIGPEIPLVSMVARFQKPKGHETFLEAARYIAAVIPAARFAVSGDNVFGVVKDEAYKRSILNMAHNDPVLRERVTYLGFYPDVREVMAAADVMVISSYFESLSMVALEAMAMQRAVVSTNVGGPSETMINGVTGYLVPSRDAKALADRVITLLKDPALRQKMGIAGRKHVLEHFTAANYATSIAQIVDSLAGTR